MSPYTQTTNQQLNNPSANTVTQSNTNLVDQTDPNFYTDYLNFKVPAEKYLDKNGNDLTIYENNPVLRADPELQKYANLIIDLKDGTFFGKRQTSDEELSKLWDQRYYGDADKTSNSTTVTSKPIFDANATNQLQNNQVANQLPNLKNFLNPQTVAANNYNNQSTNSQNPFNNFTQQTQQNYPYQNQFQTQQPIYTSNVTSPIPSAPEFSTNSVPQPQNDSLQDNTVQDDAMSANLLNQSLTSQLAPQNVTAQSGHTKIEARGGSQVSENLNEQKNEQDTLVESQVEKLKEQLKEDAAKEKLIKPQAPQKTVKEDDQTTPKDLSKTIESVLGNIKLYGYSAPSSAINKIARSKDPKSLFRNFDSYSARSWLFALLGKLALKQKQEQEKKK